jgi:hypothetical protein
MPIAINFTEMNLIDGDEESVEGPCARTLWCLYAELKMFLSRWATRLNKENRAINDEGI